MIDVKTKTSIDTDSLRSVVMYASRKAMYRASGYLMQCARRKIRYRSYRMSSRPGLPPFKHRTGSNSFSHSIRFGVDAAGTTALIGPQRENKPENVSGPVPHTLEFGGRISAGPNVFWWQKKNAPMTARSVSAVAAWVQQQGWGPLFVGKSYADVQSQAHLAEISKVVKDKSDRGLIPQERIKIKRTSLRDPSKKYKPGQYELVYYLPMRIKTARQANRAAKNIVAKFGYPTIAASDLKSRPYMGPTLEENRENIAPFWRDIVK